MTPPFWLGMKACEQGYSVRSTTIQDLAARLRAALADQSVEARIAEFVEPDLVILDELGFTPLEPLLADAFYRIVASRYERASTIVTSNKSFESWVEVFPDAVIASAVLDRLVHHAHLVPIVGESYRMKDVKSRKQGALKGAAAAKKAWPAQSNRSPSRGSRSVTERGSLDLTGYRTFLALAESARNWGNWQWWPFWLVDFIAAALLIAGAALVLRGGRGGNAVLCVAWGFTTAMFYSSSWSHIEHLAEPADGNLSQEPLTIIIGIMWLITIVGFALATIASRKPPA